MVGSSVPKHSFWGPGACITLPAVTDMLMVRHGESEWNALGRWQGHADSPLSEFGRLQAEHAGRRVADLLAIDVVVASDLSRAAETAAIIGGVLGLEVHTEPGLRERSAGEWEGLTRAEIEVQWPGYLDEERRPPAFEKDDELLERVKPAVDRVLREHEGRHILVVSHAGVLRVLDRNFGVEGDRIPNLGGRYWHAEGDGDLRQGEVVVLVEAGEVTRPDET